MLSTAVLHLADLWNMLTLEYSEGVAFDPDTALLTPVTEIPPVVLTAMKTKLENSLEWCQLARSRLRDITTKRDTSRDTIRDSVVPTTTSSALFHHPQELAGGRSTDLWQSHRDRGMGSELKRANSFASPSPRARLGVQNVYTC